MRLTRLDMQGFKSFMDKTVLEFTEPITVIVGPNGCGKSNVVDAIRWVMGEQSPKHLRGTHMEDVIFNGSEREAPLGMASVEITFSAERGGFPPPYHELGEVAICRRLYRDGTSDYLINRHPVRLRDISDFFAGTGLGKAHYAIVEQGRIAQLITAKPEERRAFIEEAAGVSRFKWRKEAALRKMEICDGNLLRLYDILQELERQMRSLERQVAKAERYKRLEEELEAKDLLLSASRYHRVMSRLAALEVERNSLKETLSALERALASEEGVFASENLKHSEEERRLSDLQEKEYRVQNSLNLMRSAFEYKGQEQSERTRSADAIATEMISLDAKARELEARRAAWQARREEMSDRVGGLHRDYDEARSRLDASQAQELALLKSLEGEKEERFRLESERLAQDGQSAHLQADLQKTQERLEALVGQLALAERDCDSVKARAKGLRQDLDALRQLRLKLFSDRDALEGSVQKKRSDVTEQESRTLAMDKELHKKRSRLESLEMVERNFEGYGEGVRALMSGESRARILGTAAQVLEVEPRYETALSALLAERLQVVLCESGGDARSFIESLKRGSQGRVAVLALEWLAAVGPRRAASVEMSGVSGDVFGALGVIGSLRDLVKAKAGFEGVADRLVGDALVVEGMDHAMALFKSRGEQGTLPVLVTLDGDIFDPSGLLIGGKSEGVGQDLFANRREQRLLADEIAALEQALGAEEARKRETKTRLEAMERELETLKQDEHRDALTGVELENRLQSAQEDLKRLEQGVAELAKERHALSETEKRLTEVIEGMNIRRAAIDARLSELADLFPGREETLAGLKARIEAERDDAAHLKARMAGADEEEARFVAEGERLETEKSDLSRLVERRGAELAAHRARLSVLETELETLVADMKRDEEIAGRVQVELAACKEAYRSGEARLRQRELDLHAMRKRAKEGAERAHALALTIEGLSHERDAALAHCEERYRVTLPQWILAQALSFPSQMVSEAEEGNVQAEVAELRDKCLSMGPVNIDAIAEFEGIKARYDALCAQKTDLEDSLNGLKKALAKIDQTTKKRLLEAYTAINVTFQKEFPRLFGGGRATLALTPEGSDDILESGVDVFAQPPGKKLQSINLLSGGEKALTALSLLFSLMSYRPSPFCILDEVDAPLDDENVHRYNDLVSAMTDRTQFILITHAKTSMEIAHSLYGVTMPEAGVSKIVSVDLGDREKAEIAA